MSDRNIKRYEDLLETIKTRRSTREFKPDAFPDEYIEMMLEAARWAPSGANSQPWSFIAVKDPEVRDRLFKAYVEINMDFIFWHEQQRRRELRHPAFQTDESDPEEALKKKQSRRQWRDAPVIIAVVCDGRKQWGTVLGAHTFSLHQPHLDTAEGNANLLIQLAATALGLSTQWVSIHIQEPFKEILGIPAPLVLQTLIPVGYAAAEGKAIREDLEGLVHYDRYDMSKHLDNRQMLERLEKLRGKTAAPYKVVI
ncbi:MAG: nitroreductase family protein [Oscillospiraceae bacterium]|nr:nitroreductase family protein [Oscillospiraceae bacterium]